MSNSGLIWADDDDDDEPTSGALIQRGRLKRRFRAHDKNAWKE